MRYSQTTKTTEDSDTMKAFILTSSLMLIGSTLLPLIRQDYWWIRIFDFPRVQIIILLVLLIPAVVMFFPEPDAMKVTLLVLLSFSLAIQFAMIYPYTLLATEKVCKAEPGEDRRGLRLLVANVLMTNRHANRFIELTRRTSPDIIIVSEIDSWWEKKLRKIERQYPHCVKYPQNNTYGLAIYSRTKLFDSQIRFLVDNDVPSISCNVITPGGEVMRLYALHPKPPHPAVHTTERDAEILMIAHEVRQMPLPVVVAGDINDVAWSNTTGLFLRISGLQDPRIGRGFYNTYNARNVFLRWPIDHVFHSPHFSLVKLEVLEDIGSDHFPVLTELCLESSVRSASSPPVENRRDVAEAEEIIGRPFRRHGLEIVRNCFIRGFHVKGLIPRTSPGLASGANDSRIEG